MMYNDLVKKILVAVVILGIVAAYTLFASQKGQQNSLAPTSTPNSPSNNPTDTPTTGSSTSTYKDGTYTGDQTDAVYGPMQAQIVISGGKITDVVFLQYPNSPGHTTEVNNAALPQLKQETIAAQNANVDIVSGATQTSDAFIQSLKSALSKAS